jgi:hypothetical protein
VKGIIYIGDFHFMHLFGLGFLASLVSSIAAGLFAASFYVWGILFLVFLYRYFRPMLKLNPKSRFLTWCGIRYISNWALMRGGFKGARTFGVWYIESSW